MKLATLIYRKGNGDFLDIYNPKTLSFYCSGLSKLKKETIILMKFIMMLTFNFDFRI